MKLRAALTAFAASFALCLVVALAAIFASLPASAASFDTFRLMYSDIPTNLGTVTVTDHGPPGYPGELSTVRVDIDLTVRMGGYSTLGLNLLGVGRIDQASLSPYFEAQPHREMANPNNYMIGSFGGFTDAIYGVNCPAYWGFDCGSHLSFNITNFQGFAPVGGVYMAAACYFEGVWSGDPRPTHWDCQSGDYVYSAVAVSQEPIVTPAPVPVPIVGAGLPGLLLGLLAMLGWRQRARR
jgi:hypothetical protein